MEASRTIAQSPPAPPPVDAAPALEVRGLSVSYRRTPVLRNVTFAVRPGELLAIVGPNGAGKSTLLRAILRLVPWDAGQVRVFGRPVEQARLEIAYVPQVETVDWDFPVTVRDVVLMGRYGRLGWLRRPRRRDHEVVDECLRTVGMTEYADRHIRCLSGGQQQRVFLARALAQEARILLLDEPFAGIDARTEETLVALMARFAADGRTLLVVNHDLQVLDRFHSVLLLNQSVIAFGPVRQAATPDNIRRTYGGRMAFIDEAERRIREGSPDVR